MGHAGCCVACPLLCCYAAFQKEHKELVPETPALQASVDNTVPRKDFSIAAGLLRSKHLLLVCAQLTSSKDESSLKIKSSQICSNTWAIACLQQVTMTSREALSRSGAFNQSPHPQKASIHVLLVVLLKDRSRHWSLTSLQPLCSTVPRRSHLPCQGQQLGQRLW